FQQQGFKVINLSRRPIPLESAEQVTADMSRPDWLSVCEASLLAKVGQAETLVLVHNAARQDFDKVSDLEAEAFRQSLQVNLVAPQQLNKALIPRMQPGSAIIYIGSTLAEKAVPGTASY